MIVSHRHRFIFIKTRKTAGTSVELALSVHCGPRDIITQELPEDEELRSSIGGVGPQNTAVPLHRWRARDLKAWLRRRELPEFLPHVPAKAARSWLPTGVWRRYFKFTIERNPWERAVSLYWWRTRDLPVRPSMSDYLMSVSDTSLTNAYLYTIRGRIAVDRVIQYDNLDSELGELSRDLELPKPLSLPRAKAGYRQDSRSYREVLGEPELSRIARVCRPEIELFGYQF